MLLHGMEGSGKSWLEDGRAPNLGDQCLQQVQAHLHTIEPHMDLNIWALSPTRLLIARSQQTKCTVAPSHDIMWSRLPLRCFSLLLLLLALLWVLLPVACVS